ncbi:MAG: Bax inhibitor-1/YccA family protein [Chloroflexi bacterium]|nr:MAG: Bax inhibitor-1/YccA family protein [Chloroflexota bacterium]
MNQYELPSSPSQLGVRPAAALSAAFLTQAFLWMFLGVLVTTGVGFWVTTLSESSLQRLSGLFFPVILLQLGIAIGLSFAIRRISATLGLGLFFLYAALTGVTIGFILLIYPITSVAAAGIGTAAIFGGAAFYGSVTKRDLTSLGAYLFMALIGLVAASLVNLFLRSDGLSYLVSWAAVVIFTALTAFDVQRIQRGDVAAWAGTMEKGAVMGAFRLYLDFINLFLALLRILGGRR